MTKKVLIVYIHQSSGSGSSKAAAKDAAVEAHNISELLSYCVLS